MQFIRPKRLPEANLQAELYKRLKDIGIGSCLEYHFKDFRLRADLIVIKQNEIICACEVKSYRTDREPHLDTKQYQKYLKLNIPIFYLVNLKNLDTIIYKITNLYNRSL